MVVLVDVVVVTVLVLVVLVEVVVSVKVVVVEVLVLVVVAVVVVVWHQNRATTLPSGVRLDVQLNWYQTGDLHWKTVTPALACFLSEAPPDNIGRVKQGESSLGHLKTPGPQVAATRPWLLDFWLRRLVLHVVSYVYISQEQKCKILLYVHLVK